MPPAQKGSGTPFVLEPPSSTSEAISLQWTPRLLAGSGAVGWWPGSATGKL